MRRWFVLVALAIVVCEAAPALAQDSTVVNSFRPRPVRPGTVSLGGQAAFGALVGGEFSNDFDNGLGAGFNLRYRTAADAAIALSFESQNFGAKVATDSAAGFSKLSLVVTTLDYMKFGSTRSKMPKYFVLGVGIAQSTIKDNDDEKEFPGDGGVFKLGAGMEYWAWRTLSFDLGVRYYGVLLRSQLNHDVQVGLGLNFYTSP